MHSTQNKQPRQLPGTCAAGWWEPGMLFLKWIESCIVLDFWWYCLKTRCFWPKHGVWANDVPEHDVLWLTREISRVWMRRVYIYDIYIYMIYIYIIYIYIYIYIIYIYTHCIYTCMIMYVHLWKTVKATISPTCSNYVMNSTGKTIYSPKKLIQECEVAGEQCGDPVAHTTSFVFFSLQLHDNNNR